MIKIKKGEEKTKRYKLEIPMRKKIIKDYDLDISSLYEPLYMRPLSEIRLFG